MDSTPCSALVGVNKPSGLTSHDVVARLRRALGYKRIGHAGTLDPQATGVLIMGVGQATRLLGLITLATKSYVASFVLGSETTTDDSEGKVVTRAAVDPCLRDPQRAAQELKRLVGTIEQVPPQVSAISQNGQRAWKAFREGSPLTLNARKVTVFDATLLGVDSRHEESAPGETPNASEVVWTVALTVSKGCYVRALARDLGRTLGCYGHVGQLVRTKSGPVGLGDCVELSALEERGWEELKKWALDPLSVANLHERALSQGALERALAGRPLEALPSDEGLVGLVASERLWGVWERRHNQLVCKANFPQGIAIGRLRHE